MGWNALAYTYLVEIFPFQQRAKGIAFEQLMVRFAVFFNTYVNPIALDRIGWKYYIVYCVWILVEIVTVCKCRHVPTYVPAFRSGRGNRAFPRDSVLTRKPPSDMIFPETYGRTLEELSFMFEGKEVQNKVENNVDKQMEMETIAVSAGDKDTSKV